MRRHTQALAGAVALAFGLLAGASAQAQQEKPAAKQPAKQAAKAPAKPVEMVREQRALDILKATSDRLAAAKSMSFRALVTYEYPSQLGPAIAYTTELFASTRAASAAKIDFARPQIPNVPPGVKPVAKPAKPAAAKTQ